MSNFPQCCFVHVVRDNVMAPPVVGQINLVWVYNITADNNNSHNHTKSLISFNICIHKINWFYLSYVNRLKSQRQQEMEFICNVKIYVTINCIHIEDEYACIHCFVNAHFENRMAEKKEW